MKVLRNFTRAVFALSIAVIAFGSMGCKTVLSDLLNDKSPEEEETEAYLKAVDEMNSKSGIRSHPH